jgi:hypothetical protein
MKQTVRSIKTPMCLVKLGFSTWGNELPQVAAMRRGWGVAAKGYDRSLPLEASTIVNFERNVFIWSGHI